MTDEHGQVIGMPDLLAPDLGVVAEYDGAVHRSRDQHTRDLAREHAFRSVGLEYAAFTGPDVADREGPATLTATGRPPRASG